MSNERNEFPNDQDEPAREMLKNESFQPFVDRGSENAISKVLKWVVNFIFALFHYVFNWPVLVFGVLSALESAYKAWINTDYTTHIKLIWLFYIFVVVLVIDRLFVKTQKNMASPEVELIWAVNFFGKIKNPAYSSEYALLITQRLDGYVNNQLKLKERELLKIIDELRDSINRLGQAADFPTEIINSLSRLISFFTDSLLYKEENNPRYSFENVLDHLLQELATINLLSGNVQQAAIMLMDDTKHLRIYGSMNIHENVRRTRRILLDEEFAGKVTKQGKVVWLDDLTSPDAVNYGFDPERVSNYPYDAIMGRPIKVIGQAYAPLGVVTIHFKSRPTFTEFERKHIVNTIELYCQLVLALLRVHQIPNLKGVYEIIGGADIEAAASIETNVE
jgi:hypothetical protein